MNIYSRFASVSLRKKLALALSGVLAVVSTAYELLELVATLDWTRGALSWISDPKNDFYRKMLGEYWWAYWLAFIAVITWLLVFPGKSNAKEDAERGMPPVSVNASQGASAVTLSNANNNTINVFQHPSTSMTDSAESTVATPTHQINPLETYFSRKVIHVAELIHGSNHIVEGKTFEDCQIYGPGVIAMSSCTVDGCGFHGGLDSIFIEVAPNRRLLGVIGFVRVTFRKCDFFGLGIAAPKNEIEYFMGSIRMLPNTGGENKNE